MIKVFKKLGNSFRSISGYVWLITVAIPTALTFASGIYEEIGLTASITLTTATFVLGILLVISISYIHENFSPSSKPITIIDLMNRALKCGWNITEDNLEILDLMDALHEAGCRGDLVFCGRRADSDFDNLVRNRPRVNIPRDEWEGLYIDWSPGLITSDGTIEIAQENFLIAAVMRTSQRGYAYKDLHIVGNKGLNKWLRKAKKDYCGRRQKQEEEREARFERLKPLLEN